MAMLRFGRSNSMVAWGDTFASETLFARVIVVSTWRNRTRPPIRPRRETKVKSTHFPALAVIVAAGVLLPGGDTATANPPIARPTTTQPPTATFTPPQVIPMRLPEGKVERILPGYFDFGLKMSYDVASAERTGRLKVFSVARVIHHDQMHQGRNAYSSMDWDEVASGELVPIAGSLYRWDQEKWEMQRVDAGPISKERMFDPAILTTRIRFSSVKDGLQIDRVRFGEPVGEEEADSVDVRIYAKGLRIGERKIEDDERRTEPYQLKRGDTIATAEWEVKVLRILRPHPETKHPGWVVLTVKHRLAE
jgi:hypothetical protein